MCNPQTPNPPAEPQAQISSDKAEVISPEKESCRDHSLDIAKGILICCVVWGHLGYHSRHYSKAFSLLGYYAGINIPDWLYQTFYMCAFFLISGMFDKSFTVKNLYKNAKCLIVPFFTLFIPFTIISSLIRNGSQNVFDIVKGIGVPWFVAALFWMKCIMYVFNRFALRARYAILISILLHYAGLFLFKNKWAFLGIEYGLVFFIFYLMGRYAKWLKMLPGLLWIVLFLSSTVLSHMLFKNFPNLQGGFKEDYLQAPISILMGLSGSLAFIKLMSKIGRNKLFEYIGKRTLIIYYLASSIQLTFIHAFFPTFKAIHTYNSYLAGVFWLILNFILPIIFCILIHNFFNKEGRRWVLGKF